MMHHDLQDLEEEGKILGGTLMECLQLRADVRGGALLSRTVCMRAIIGYCLVGIHFQNLHKTEIPPNLLESA